MQLASPTNKRPMHSMFLARKMCISAVCCDARLRWLLRLRQDRTLQSNLNRTIPNTGWAIEWCGWSPRTLSAASTHFTHGMSVVQATRRNHVITRMFAWTRGKSNATYHASLNKNQKCIADRESGCSCARKCCSTPSEDVHHVIENAASQCHPPVSSHAHPWVQVKYTYLGGRNDHANFSLIK